VLRDSGPGSWSGILRAMETVVDAKERSNRPSVMSMSLGGSGTLTAAAQAINSAMASGVAVVVAAGNSNSDACGFPQHLLPMRSLWDPLTEVTDVLPSAILAPAQTSGPQEAQLFLLAADPILDQGR
jgi:cerevisin